MNPVEYVFRIDVFTPQTLPMGRLAEYLSALAKMFGHSDHTHFVAVDPGSARLRAAIESVDAPKVAARLDCVRLGDGPKDAMAAKQTLEDLLANDNAVGTLTEAATERVVVPFVGRNRPRALVFPPFREDSSIDGKLVSIGGRDSTAHAILQDGNQIHSGVTMRRDLARELAKLLYGPTIRLYGNGRFERQPEGLWRMTDFKVDRYDILDNRPIRQVLEATRAVPNNGLMEGNAYQDIAALSDDVEDGDIA